MSALERELFYYLHSAQLCQPAVQGLWLTLGHKTQAQKRPEGEARLEVTLCGVKQCWIGHYAADALEHAVWNGVLP